MKPTDYWRTGDKVSGNYCGEHYTGTLDGISRPTPDGRNVIFVVNLDKPIRVFGGHREKIEIWTNSKYDVINKVDAS